MEKHPLHIKNPELQAAPEAQRAVQRIAWLAKNAIGKKGGYTFVGDTLRVSR